MKKMLLSLWLCLSFMIMSISQALAVSYDTSQLDLAFEKAIAYYQNNNKLEDPDQIIAVEALGLEAEDGFDVIDLKNQDFQNLDLGGLCKSIIALTLMGEDPYHINGVNTVDILNSYIHEDGSIQNSYGSSSDIWVLLTLESVNSDKVELVADHLATTLDDYNAFWYEYNGKISDPAITGWGIEALSIANAQKYQETIQKAIGYLRTTLYADGSFKASDYYNADGDTQACVLEGLFVADQSQLLNGMYDQENGNPIDVLLSFQLEDGSFKMANWSTGEYEFNSYTTLEGARCLGTYKNGSFVIKAQRTYAKINQNETPEETKDLQNKLPQVENKVEKEEKKKVVNTGDEGLMLYLYGLVVVSGILFIVKRYEKNS